MSRKVWPVVYCRDVTRLLLIALVAVLPCLSCGDRPEVSSASMPSRNELNAPPSAEPMRVGGDVKAPVAIHRVDPELRRCGGKLRASGIPILEMIVDRNGAVQQVRAIKSANPCIDAVFVEAMRQWRFKPAMYHGKPVAVVYNITLQIHLS